MTYPLAYYLVSFLFGSVVGSFLNVCIFRIPSDKSIVFPPSHCPSCGNRIAAYDNIPIVSYLILRGQCRCCKEKISLQYPVVELINGILTLLLFAKFGLTADFFVGFLFCSALVVITFIDLEHRIIPDRISLPGIIIGFIASFFVHDIYDLNQTLGWKNSLIGILAGGGSLFIVAYAYELVTKKEGMGMGDVKLLAMMGAFLGWRSIPFIIFFSSLVGSIIGVSMMLLQKKDSQYAIPFGPFLALGAICYIFVGQWLIHWYFSLGGGFRG
jgi:leader peptidase (prepilin peptidase) / N-methyltransferase